MRYIRILQINIYVHLLTLFTTYVRHLLGLNGQILLVFYSRALMPVQQSHVFLEGMTFTWPTSPNHLACKQG